MVTPMISMASKQRRRTHRLAVQRRLRRNPGFTLVEMMIVVSIIALLLAIGVPSFRYVTTSNRASTEINGLVGDLQFARSEAIREGQQINVCATTNGTSCVGSGTTWHTGWLVMQGTNILRIQPAFTSLDTLQSNHTVNTVSFSREGFASGLPSAITFTLNDSTSNAQYRRCLSLTIICALSTQIGGKLTAEAPNTC
jgi:type IV fimbrial biogenesis protein FimT